jgi:hypothetical protein
LWLSDPLALQGGDARLGTELIRQRLEYWALVVEPKFSNKDRSAA